MKGTLHKTEQGWVVSRCVGDGVAEVWEETLLLHPADVQQINKDSQVFDNIEARIAAYPEVEFEMVYVLHTDNQTDQNYAKLIHHSVESNEMIDHIGDANEMVDPFKTQMNMIKKWIKK